LTTGTHVYMIVFSSYIITLFSSVIIDFGEYVVFYRTVFWIFPFVGKFYINTNTGVKWKK